MKDLLPATVEKTLSRYEVGYDLQALLAKFTASLDVKPNSKGTYKRGLHQFFRWMWENEIRKPDRNHILAFKHHLLTERGLSSLTVSNYLVGLKQFFKWTECEKLYPHIANGIKTGRRPRGHRKDSLTVPQVVELLESIDRSTLAGLRDYAIINTLVRTGLRSIEIVRADACDIRHKSGKMVLWIMGKGQDSKSEFSVLTPACERPIREYLVTRGSIGENEPLFVSLSKRNRGERLTTRSISRIVKERLRGIGINNSRLTCHSLRHTSCSFLLEAGGTIFDVQALARHREISTSMAYCHHYDRIRNAPEEKIDEVLDTEAA